MKGRGDMVKSTRQISLGVALVAAALILAGTTLNQSRKEGEPLFTGEGKISLQTLWSQYKQRYWESERGRTIDPQRDNITTSEGQSYTMLRAVWMDDRPTFDTTWNWTMRNLQRSDKLFSWQWGTKADGSHGVLTDQGGQNSATDGDSDIAFALAMAAQKWQEPRYRDSAKGIIQALWEHEVVMIAGKPYLTANNLEKTSTSPAILVNPSYLAPYAYRTFSTIDPSHDWDSLVSSSYELLREASQAHLNVGQSAGLPPNWVALDRKSGELRASDNPQHDTDFGFDAFRTVWRVALDWHWYRDQDAHDTLADFGFLRDQWNEKGKLAAIYTHNGRPKADYAVPALYGSTLGYFQALEPKLAQAIYTSQFLDQYSSGTGWKQPLNYYDDNWAWFGIGLYQDQLPNLADG
jgi:endo-1,4-beta-D-glucanase Y